MDDPCEHFFSSPSFSEKENSRVGVCHLHDLLEYALHRRTPCNDVFHAIQFVDKRLESLDLSSHPLWREPFFDLGLEFLVIERLGEISEGPSLHGFHGVGYAAVGREDDDRQAWMNPQQFLRHI